MKTILGISAFYHDSAATILVDGKIIAAAQEERFTRKKHDASYPFNAIEFVLNFAKIKLSDVDQVIFFEKPFLKFERLLETYVAFAPRGFKSFCMAMPVWLKDKLFQKKILFNELKRHDDNFIDDKNIEILLVDKFIGERGRINCSLRESSGFWRWLGVQFVVSDK